MFAVLASEADELVALVAEAVLPVVLALDAEDVEALLAGVADVSFFAQADASNTMVAITVTRTRRDLFVFSNSMFVLLMGKIAQRIVRQNGAVRKRKWGRARKRVGANLFRMIRTPVLFCPGAQAHRMIHHRLQ